MKLLGKGSDPSLSPKEEFGFFGNGVDQWFNSMLSDWPAITTTISPRILAGPSVDVKELADHFLVKVDVPGMNKDDLKVSIDGNVLRIEGSREEEKREEDAKKGYLRAERFYGSFSRSIALPAEVKADAVKASCSSGVLTLNLPKAAPQAPKGKTINID